MDGHLPVLAQFQDPALAVLARRPGTGAGLKETPAFIGGEVLAAVGVDELEVADQARHFTWRNVHFGICAMPRQGLPELEIPVITPCRGPATGRKCDTMEIVSHLG